MVTDGVHESVDADAIFVHGKQAKTRIAQAGRQAFYVQIVGPYRGVRVRANTTYGMGDLRNTRAGFRLVLHSPDTTNSA